MNLKNKIYLLFAFFSMLIAITYFIRNFDWDTRESIASDSKESASIVERSDHEVSATSDFSRNNAEEQNNLPDPTSFKKKSNSLEKERSYRFYLSEESKVEFPVSEGLFRYSIVENRLYFADQNHQIWKLNLDDLTSEKLVETGTAPQENENVSSVRASENALYIVDIDKRSFRRQDFKGNVIHQDLKLNYITYNGTYLNENYGISLRDDKSNSAFEVYNFDSMEIQREYKLVELFDLTKDLEFAEVITEGFFIGGSGNGTMYIPGRFGEFIMFDSVGNIDYKGLTIDKTEKPRVKKEKVFNNSYMYVREPDYYVNYSASMNSKYLIILSLDEEKSTHTNLDFYSVTSGEYLGSAKIDKFSDERPTEVMLTEENDLWVLFENYTFVKYNCIENEV